MTDKEKFAKLWAKKGKGFSGLELSYYQETGEISSFRICFLDGFSITLHPMGNIIKLEIPEVIR